jgi:L-amino acid N-acyltransferase
MTMQVQLVDCDRGRAAEILAILNEAIEHSTALYDYQPRPLASMDAWFRVKEQRRYPVIGAIDADDRLLGFASYGQFRAWPAYKYTVEHSIYVERSHRGRGIGALLLAAVIERARAQDYHTLIGGIDAENAASIALHRRFGFEPCGRVRHAGFKFNRWLDLDFYQLILETPAHPVDG